MLYGMSTRRKALIYVMWVGSLVLIYYLASRNRKTHEDLRGQKKKSELSTQQKSHTQLEDDKTIYKRENFATGAPITGDSVKDQTTDLVTQKKLNRDLENNNFELKKTMKELKEQNVKLKIKRQKLKILLQRLTAVESRNGEKLPKLDPTIPWVFAITPTFERFTQKADLVRLYQTLQHVTNLHWIVVEDSKNKTRLVKNVLLDSKLSYTHLNIRTSVKLQRKKGERYNKHHRGVPQRNLGLKWIRNNVDPEKTPGAVYFMDDDNTYHTRIFDEMRWTKKVSVWPVALTGGARWAGPIVSNGKVVSFHTNWAKDRKFPIDMAAFAVSLNLIVNMHSDAVFDDSAKRGYLEPTFLKTITSIEELEPLADNCTEILVWHTRTEKPKESIKGEKQLISAGTPSNPDMES